MMLRYIIFGFIFAAGVGPVNIETAKRGLTGKSLSALLFYLGNVIVDALYILLLMYGVSVLIENTTVKFGLGICGIVYLFYLGIENVKDFQKKDVFTAEGDLSEKKTINPFLEGILVNLANPMAIASWAAFLSVASSDFNKSLLNFAAVVLGAVLLGVTLILLALIFKRVVTEKVMRIISLVSGSVLVFFSLLFAYKLFFI